MSHKFGDWPISKSKVKALNIPATRKQLEIDQASPPDSLHEIPLVQVLAQALLNEDDIDALEVL